MITSERQTIANQTVSNEHEKCEDLIARAKALIKGSLHTDELIGEMLKRETGLRALCAIAVLLEKARRDNPSKTVA